MTRRGKSVESSEPEDKRVSIIWGEKKKEEITSAQSLSQISVLGTPSSNNVNEITNRFLKKRKIVTSRPSILTEVVKLEKEREHKEEAEGTVKKESSEELNVEKRMKCCGIIRKKKNSKQLKADYSVTLISSKIDLGDVER